MVLTLQYAVRVMVQSTQSDFSDSQWDESTHLVRQMPTVLTTTPTQHHTPHQTSIIHHPSSIIHHTSIIFKVCNPSPIFRLPLKISEGLNHKYSFLKMVHPSLMTDAEPSKKVPLLSTAAALEQAHTYHPSSPPMDSWTHGPMDILFQSSEVLRRTTSSRLSVCPTRDVRRE